ncbi:MAG: ECF transporter S component [Erysipelotrichaceae bacterium]|nr:ECF transporter S component [Erysipelotrichaceae bacterium]
MNNKIKRFSLLTMFVTIEVLFAVVPFLGYIPLPVINITTLHMPVIIAAMLLGPKEGGIVGFVFGLTSLIKNTMTPNLTSFLFSPFYSVGGTSGNFMSVLIAIVPRVLIGVVAGYVYQLLKKKVNVNISMVISSVLGAFVNTFLVMSSAYIFFGQEYAAARGVEYSALLGVILTVVFTNGLAESIAAGIICPIVTKVGERLTK